MRQLTIRSTFALVAVALVALALVQLGSARTDRQTAATTIQVKGGEYFFRLSAKSIAKPGSVTFVFKNIGHALHDFSINGKRTALTQPGKTAKLTVAFKKKGTYRYVCTVAGHAAAGMKGNFTVR